MAACPLARRAGVRVGMTLAEARATCAGLADDPLDAPRDARALAAVGRWLAGRLSPVASVEPPESVLLEVGGSAAIFGGVDAARRAAADALRRAGLTACAAVAPTPGAAWALASAGRAETVAGDSAVLGSLPLACLRLPGDVVAALAGVGVRTVGQLAALPRSAVPTRFGDLALLRLDQATGAAPEPLACLSPEVPVSASLEFDAPVAQLAGLWACLKHLVADAVTDLARRGAGARRVRLTLVPRWGERESVEVRLATATRSAVRLFDLLRTAAEPALGRVKSHDGYVGFRLDVPSFERVVPGQSALFAGADGDARAASELAGLVERLVARLGEPSVGRAEPVESHLPERAWRWSGVSGGGCEGAGCESAGAAGGFDAARWAGDLFGVASGGRRSSRRPRRASGPLPDPSDDPIERHGSLRPRPLRLLDPPAEVGVMAVGDGPPASLSWPGPAVALAECLGPERVAGLWWDGHRRTRDYYDALDDAGRRYWLFRVDDPRTGRRRWFVHGVFD